jgi:DNA processing protein
MYYAAMATDLGRPWSPEELLGPLNTEEARYAPKQLFAVGHTEWLQRSPRVAIVGARKATLEGQRRAVSLVRILVDHDVAIVSGLAEGIDAVAHSTTIESGGRTIAVIGTPLDEFYPARNRGLQLRLMAEHLVISQFPSGYPVTRKSFPLRNRTMALICEASVIVEASDGSGSLSHGWEALRLVRPLFLLASLLERADLAWPKQMLDYGAMVLRGPDELLAQLPAPIEDPLAVLA